MVFGFPSVGVVRVMITRAQDRVIDLTDVPRQRGDIDLEIVSAAGPAPEPRHRPRAKALTSPPVVTGVICLLVGVAIGATVHPGVGRTSSRPSQPQPNLSSLLLGTAPSGSNAGGTDLQSATWLFAVPMHESAGCVVEAAGFRGITCRTR